MIVEPDRPPLAADDLRRLFPDGPPASGCAERLAHWPRILTVCGSGINGLATYQRSGDELRVGDLAADRGGSCSLEEIFDSLLDALENACLAGGGSRVVVLPGRPEDEMRLRRRGYRRIQEGCAGTWLEKNLVGGR